MTKILYLLILSCLLYSCYPSHSLQSAKVLEKGKSSGSISVSAPLPFPTLGLRLGLGQNFEVGAKSSYLSHEIGIKHALKKDKSKTYQHALGFTLGNTFIETNDDNEFYYEINYEGDSSLTQRTQELDVVVFTIPYYLSLHNRKDFLRFYSKLAPTFSKSIEFDKFGIITCAGISIGKKVSINAELFSHIPISNIVNIEPNDNNLINILPLYNIGFQLGIVVGQF